MNKLPITWAVLCCLLSIISIAQELGPEHLKQMEFRHIGPVGNRLISVTGVPTDPMIYYVGAASGGIWKTTDAGLNWRPVFDKQPVHSIGALALAPSDPEIVYAGTGESFIRSNVSIGNGVWKTMDGGAHWQHLGLDESGRISRVVVHPTDPDLVYIASLGHAYTPQEDRGIFRSKDGGMTWEHVLKVDEHTGASDLVMDPHNPRILFAGMWQLAMRPWTRVSGGPGSGIYRSLDGGDTWQRLSKGLPEGDVGKIALTMTAAKPGRLYALIETGDGIPLDGEKTNTGELWRSEDRGNSFTLINSDRNLTGRGAYYTRCHASPDNANEIYFFSAAYATSIDGGKSATPAAPGTAPNWDHHEMWIDPTDGNRQIVVGDGGLSISPNRGASWHRVQLPVAQLYHVTTDKAIPYNVLTNRQDGPSMRGPSRSRMQSFFGGFIPTGMWHDVGGGESGFATADPTDPNIVWSSASGFGALGGVVVRYNHNTGQFRQVEVWPEYTAGSPAAEVKYRFQWTFPLLISPHDHNTVYVASQHVHRTQNGGQTWEIISPDLSLNDKEKQQFSGGLTGDNIGVEYANVVYAFDESPLKQGLFWAGTNDGLVHVSEDGGANWTNVTDRISDMPEYGAVRNIEASSHAEGTAYLTVDAHEMGDFAPYVYRTSDYGKTWKKIIDGIADTTNLSYCRMVKEDPVRAGLLYLGTENALYISYDEGEHWQSLQCNLPASPMYWMDIPEHFNDLVVGTYGRGIWILDDITPFQQLTSDIKEKEAHLFAPKDAYRFHPVSMVMQFFKEASFGDDPPAGASLHFWLGNGKDTMLQDSVHLIITSTAGDTVRTLKHKGVPGINRLWWDFKDQPTTQIQMRTKPRYAAWLPLGDRRVRKPMVAPLSVMVPPGQYNIDLVIDSQSIQRQTLQILKDPNSEGTLDDIGAQQELLHKIKADVEEISKAVNGVERIRRQLRDLIPMLPKERTEIKEKILQVDTLLTNVENDMIQLQHTGTGQDQIRKPGKLLEKLSYLASAVAVADFPPADQHQEVFAEHHQKWMEVEDDLAGINAGALTELVDLLKEHNVGPIIMGQ